MIRKRLSKRVSPEAGYQPRLAIVAEGRHEVYRLARFLELAGLKNGAWVAYHHLGVRILTSMDEQAPGAVAELAATIGPVRATYRGRRRPKPVQLAIGMGEAELEQAEEAVR